MDKGDEVPALSLHDAIEGLEEDIIPATMIWALSKQALEGLASTHQRGECHGNLTDTALLLTYPLLEGRGPQEVLDFYNGEMSADELFAGTERESRDPAEFLCVTLQNRDPDLPHTPPPERFCPPPPELLVERSMTPAADVWCLASLLADLASGTPFFATLLGAHHGGPADRLRHAQRFLGPLPPRFRDALSPPDPATPAPLRRPYTEGALLEAIRDGPVAEKVPRFEGEALRQLVEVLKGMLVYEPEQRWTVERALAHEFFAKGSLKVKRT